MYLIVIVAAIVIWFLLTIVFKPLGSVISKIWEDTSKTLNEKDEKEEDSKNG